MSRAACTIVSPNYLAFARTLAKAYLAHHPDHQFFVLIVADLKDSSPFAKEPFTIVMLSQIGIPDLRATAMKYDILELNTNVKPTFMKFLFSHYFVENLVYLDPDIFVYSTLDPVFQELNHGASAVLTPHMTAPIFDGLSPSEQEILYNGTYNLGFIAFRRCAEATKLLDWWEQRCLELGYSEGRTGLFVDQKWMNLAPCFFGGITVLRDAGCNMAYWNLHERVIENFQNHAAAIMVSSINGCVPLRFFHFSGIALTDPEMLSKNTNRYSLAHRTDLLKLFAEYKVAVLENKDLRLESLPYGFDTFSDGTVINRLARRIYAVHAKRWAGEDPFDVNSGFALFAKKIGLMDGKIISLKTTWSDFRAKDRRVEAVHALLKLTLRLIGPVRYELLMRYLAHISVLRNQGVFLDDKQREKR